VKCIVKDTPGEQVQSPRVQPVVELPEMYLLQALAEILSSVCMHRPKTSPKAFPAIPSSAVPHSNAYALHPPVIQRGPGFHPAP
jgi:hypothetical protein